MNKLLYIAPVIIDLEKLNGVSKKVLNHYKIFRESYKADMISYGPNCLYHFHDNSVDTIPLGKLKRRLKLYSFIKTNLVPNQYECIYIRYHLSDFLFIYLLKLLNNSKIAIEIPTYPYKHELLKSQKGLLRYLIDITSRSFLKLYVGRIVTYSEDVNIFGIKTINTINGIIYDNLIPSQKKNRPELEINLISVSVTMICHGYDRLIVGLNDYYKNGGNVNVFYHLVGDGIEIEKYKGLVEKYKLGKYVKFYGFKGGQELDEIYDKVDIAINSLAIHRIGLKTESTIKSKEYAAKGLPMVSSYEIDAFSPEDNKKYVLKISADESAVNIDQLIQFYGQVYNDTLILSTDIRNASRKRSDMRVTLKGIIDYFNTSI
ncbi:glycosyltransferase family 1 protein [Flavobacterium bomense]|uniref:Glycosyltransferase family 1 protein n=1 Tax=Flavobacterium bomense TaxID=2497483 RepID=A0A3S0UX77_9FLAO|nr:glycosyltransferase [Flavobacterium bomense]RTZ02048.1 glycosyltransferase family 1 protein [Flavobacterium bomense]